MALYGIPPAGLRRALAPDDGGTHAHQIVEQAHGWWVEHHGGAGGPAAAVGVVAAVALAAPRSAEGPDHGSALLPLDDDGVAAVLLRVWNGLWFAAPTLADLTRPLHRWLADADRTQTAGLANFTRILVRAGLLEYCSDIRRCESEDVLGLLLQRFRSRAERQQSGAFFTPARAADAHAQILLSPPPPYGARFLEPCAGTGTIVRAAAATLRHQGLDPAQFHWWLNDLDPISAACCAVNAVLWRLGPNVTVSCANALHGIDGIEAEVHARAEAALRARTRRPVLYPAVAHAAHPSR
ncbi:hypothetical protein BIV57_13440 [Mangrovactinospora gilvigrisea]|uniref:DNA methylase adenine-specific domain-containing protein n=1 Tax=Mangrovactinospora gilvigrisea TaxID=1428644 RepID=A0A1J7CBH2_9ACTN|nr:hypothetical protein [Mangrovactinospora gilvigrisea]OIV36986.1 hypothetical protein BIV57_13440 [Mangrovactinospora gilvigrisea]